MKITILLAALGLFSLTACTKSALDNNGGGSANVVDASAVPTATRTAFATEFSGATGVEWQRNSSSSFTVQFNQSSERHSAGYDDSGHRSSHSIICLDGPVPQVVLDAFRLRFPTDNVYEWKLMSDGNWKPHFMRGSLKYEAIFSAAGVFIKFEQAG